MLTKMICSLRGMTTKKTLTLRKCRAMFDWGRGSAQLEGRHIRKPRWALGRSKTVTGKNIDFFLPSWYHFKTDHSLSSEKRASKLEQPFTNLCFQISFALATAWAYFQGDVEGEILTEATITNDNYQWPHSPLIQTVFFFDCLLW